MVSAAFGRRTEELTALLVEEFRERTGGRVMRLMTSDENPAYAAAIREAYGVGPARALPGGLVYATVHKEREGGRVVRAEPRLVFGTMLALLAALALSLVSRAVNVSFLERYNGTDRGRNGRKVRRTYGFSKDWWVHEAVSRFTLYSYNFCWCVRTLREERPEGGYRQRTPAVAAGLADHVWTMEEWLTFPGANRSQAIASPGAARQC